MTKHIVFRIHLKKEIDGAVAQLNFPIFSGTRCGMFHFCLGEIKTNERAD